MVKANYELSIDPHLSKWGFCCIWLLKQSKTSIALEKLSPEARSAIAQAAAEARWNKASEATGEARLQRATHTGELDLNGVKIPCAVLEDGTRVITQRGMFVALGMNKNPSKGQSAIDNRPGFLSANNLTPYISEDLKRSWTPVPFRLPKGGGGYKGNIAFGYNATILPMVCHVYEDAKEGDVLTKAQSHIATAAKIISRGFSIVGIVALVDEATEAQSVLTNCIDTASTGNYSLPMIFTPATPSTPTVSAAGGRV